MGANSDEEFWSCPKCQATSGDDWSHCELKCCLAISPFYSREVAAHFGAPVPYELLEAARGAIRVMKEN